MPGKLTDLQTDVLAILAPVQPAWTLTGGGALCGFHLQHRTTRDLDLFWHGLTVFTHEPADCERLLRDAKMQIDILQRAPAFVRLRCANDREAVVIDLVAEPVAAIEPPQQAQAGQKTIRIDTEHEIFVNKLGALLHRAEVRDLVDLRALLLRGADLVRGLRDAARKDGGFSPLMVGHLLQSFPMVKLATAAGLSASATSELTSFRDDLAKRIATLTQP